MALTTRVVRFSSTGGPDVLRIVEQPMPAPADGEVRLRVQALGLNRAEAAFRAGQYLEAPQLPARIGYEAAGIVDAVGPGVTTVRPGDAVCTLPGFSMSRYGVYAEHALVPAAHLIAQPEGFRPLDAAALWMAYLTAYGALVDIGQLGAGDVVLVGAASSSVGLATIQLARYLGAVPVALSRSPHKAAALCAHGAQAVLDPEAPQFAERIRELSGGRGARLAFDPVAGPGVAILARTLGQGGTLVIYGNLSGQAEQTPFPFYDAVGRGLSMRGYLVFELINDAARLARAQACLQAALADGRLKPVIDRVFDFDDIVAAHRHLESNRQVGKIVVRVSDD
ncbi:zinc-dependent alcohol dehydrogenase family protein [Denitromonas iodatirespirans]|uniref:Zinc-dependent alcohol dehydrogenase family protein n=1 Tax=Denitromonas iodatirespirans TaxID=2795389 RepID=A0A944DHF9_DENI1|nr:zinc-dependent alcohol dehydrogenase family protein [Denitromonas iodatirespirans]MBT0962943.1 zinc-dependent alcohol dehydrogenase family protein [Denitromonas iodatirespirans]